MVAAVMAMAKTAKTPEEVVEAKIEWSGTGKGMPQTPAEVFVPAGAKATPAPITPAPSPMLTLDGCLDAAPKEVEFVPSAKDQDEPEEIAEPNDEGDALDEEQTRERLIRALRKADRFAGQLHVSLESAVRWYRDWQAACPAWGTKHPPTGLDSTPKHNPVPIPEIAPDSTPPAKLE